MRVWSSPCSESSLQRTVGRSGVLEADSTLVILWKADEGEGDILRNSRPLHPPKPARGSKEAVSSGGGGTGAEGHAELVGEWAWVPCFDPDDYESASPSAGGLGQASPAAGVADLAGAVGAPSSSSSTAQRSGRQGEEGLGELAEGGSTDTDTDLARSLGWRSVSTAGDEEEEEEGEEAAGASARGREKRGPGSEGRVNSSPSCSACADAGANATAAGASAALEACAAIERGAGVGEDGGVLRDRLPPREALLGLLGKLFQQCSVYLEPCRGDPLVESTPPPRGVRVEARVQLQLLRREEGALRAIVQPEVHYVCMCPSCQPQSAAGGCDVVCLSLFN